MDKNELIDMPYGAKLFSDLKLPAILGRQFAVILMLEEMLIGLLQAGALNNEQVESMLSRVSAEIGRICNKAEKDLDSRNDYSAADLEAITNSVDSIMARIRKRLKDSQ
jgi:hypothetical protein